jgi:hypothetical protein
MAEAAEQAGQNRLARTGQLQNDALETVRQMLQQLQQTEDRWQEILRRTLEDLGQAIERLVDQQAAQLDRLNRSPDLAGLETPLSVLRRNTLSVAQSAREVGDTVEAAELLERAAISQGNSITALRARERDPALTGETEALASLELVLEVVQQLNLQAEDQLTRQQRGKLIAAYQQLTQQQEALVERTRPLMTVVALNRRCANCG